MLKNLDRMFDETEATEQIKAYNELYNSRFKMHTHEIFDEFMIRFTIVIASLNLFDAQLLMTLKRKLIEILRENIRHLIECKFFNVFVDEIKRVDLNHQKKRKAEAYMNFYPLIKKTKKQLNDEDKCYKCHQSDHRVDDRDASCKNKS